MITQDFAESNLPHNKEAEEFLLGSILFGGMASKAIVDQFRSEFFYFARHQVIFQQIQFLLAEEGVIEPVFSLIKWSVMVFSRMPVDAISFKNWAKRFVQVRTLLNMDRSFSKPLAEERS